MSETENNYLREFIYQNMFGRCRGLNREMSDVMKLAFNSKTSSEFKLKLLLNGFECSDEFQNSIGKVLDTFHGEKQEEAD